MRSRISRLSTIVEILTNNNISCQEELLKQLAIRGFIVTQATLSRDLKKLRTTKVANDLGGYRYVVAGSDVDSIGDYDRLQPTVQSSLHPAVISLAISGNILVIKTRNGYASGVAYDLDMLESPLILGTIPGADTVFAVVAENASRQDIFALMRTFLPPQVIEEAKGYFE